MPLLFFSYLPRSVLRYSCLAASSAILTVSFFSAFLYFLAAIAATPALAATAAAICSGMTAEEISDGLATYTGVSRRFEFLCQRNGVRYFDDYAHHPDEIRVTLAAAKAITKGKVICVFQPHNYSRLRDLFEDFCTSFADADLLVLTKLYAARESAGEEVSSALLAEQTGAVYMDSLEEIPAYLDGICREGDTVLIMGAGDIGKLAEKMKKR